MIMDVSNGLLEMIDGSLIVIGILRVVDFPELWSVITTRSQKFPEGTLFIER
jgi:hypothetical protein